MELDFTRLNSLAFIAPKKPSETLKVVNTVFADHLRQLFKQPCPRRFVAEVI